MKNSILLLVLIAIVGFASAFEFDVDSTTAEVLPGENANFEFDLFVPDRMIDTIDIYLHNDIPDGWTATACTPWECFFEHAVIVIAGPDTALMSAHFITDAISHGTGTMAIVFQSAVSGQTDSIIFTVTAESYIAESKIPSRTDVSLYPNPFNSSCRIKYSIDGNGEFEILDIDGKIVYRENIVGSGILHWNPTDEHSGIYFVRIITNDGIVQKKSIYLR